MKPLGMIYPDDLITIKEAMELVGGLTRSWMEPRLTFYRVGRNDKVSKRELLRAYEEYNTPKPKDKLNDEKGD